MYADRQADSGRQRCRSACLSRTGGNDNKKGVDGRCTDGRPISQTSTPRYALSKSGASPRWTLDHTSTLYRLARPDIRRSWSSCMQVQGLGFTGISPPSCLRAREHRATPKSRATLTHIDSVSLPAEACPPCGFAFPSSSVRLSLSRYTHLCLSLLPIPYFESLSPRVSIPFALLARAGDLSLHFTSCLRLPLRVSQLPVIVARSRPGKSRAHAATTSSRASHHSLTHS